MYSMYRLIISFNKNNEYGYGVNKNIDKIINIFNDMEYKYNKHEWGDDIEMSFEINITNKDLKILIDKLYNDNITYRKIVLFQI